MYYKGLILATDYSAAYTSHMQKHMTVLIVAADWNKPYTSKQMYLQCSKQTYDHPDQPHQAFTLKPISCYSHMLLRVGS